jgi:hypothetical protein
MAGLFFCPGILFLSCATKFYPVTKLGQPLRQETDPSFV